MIHERFSKIPFDDVEDLEAQGFLSHQRWTAPLMALSNLLSNKLQSFGCYPVLGRWPRTNGLEASPGLRCVRSVGTLFCQIFKGKLGHWKKISVLCCTYMYTARREGIVGLRISNGSCHISPFSSHLAPLLNLYFTFKMLWQFQSFFLEFMLLMWLAEFQQIPQMPSQASRERWRNQPLFNFHLSH